MDESDIKGIERISTITVEGYDTSIQEYSLKLALEKHFVSRGKIAHIDVPRDFKRRILKSPLFINFWGEGARDKALKLSGIDMGGWNAVVKAAPRQEYDVDPARFNYFKGERRLMVLVNGIPSSLRKIDVEIRLCKHFSSCGEVTRVFVMPTEEPFITTKGFWLLPPMPLVNFVPPLPLFRVITLLSKDFSMSDSKAVITIMGKGCVEKAQELSGQSNPEGWNIVVDRVVPPRVSRRASTGCEHPFIVPERLKKAEIKKKAKMEKMEAKMDKGKKKMKKTTE